jgi:hypothetical protein
LDLDGGVARARQEEQAFVEAPPFGGPDLGRDQQQVPAAEELASALEQPPLVAGRGGGRRRKGGGGGGRRVSGPGRRGLDRRALDRFDPCPRIREAGEAAPGLALDDDAGRVVRDHGPLDAGAVVEDHDVGAGHRHAEQRQRREHERSEAGRAHGAMLRPRTGTVRLATDRSPSMRPSPHTLAVLALALAPLLAGCGEKPADAPASSTNGSSVFGRGPADRGPGPFTATLILIGARNPRSPEVERSKLQARNAALEVMKKLESGTKIDDIVRAYTDDKGSLGRPGEKDGQYRNFPAGAMVPAFEQAVRETPIGKIYPDPVETEFGYHIIRRDK